MTEIFKAVLFGIVEGITEWLPISSTGHMILLDEFVRLNMTPEFVSMFLVVIQLGAIMAVVLLYFPKFWPFGRGMRLLPDKAVLWAKILLACVPAAVVGLLFNDAIDAYFYHPWTVAVMLILFGAAFIAIENRNQSLRPHVNDLNEIGYKHAFWIGMFQLIAAVFPGTSRSGATILGGIVLGLRRETAAEFTFFLAIPVMFGASLLKVAKHGFTFSGHELAVLGTGMLTSFIVSILAIKFLMAYIKNNDFKAFGWYRIVLGLLVILYFTVWQ
ncbi:undecaprenyl-diphosphate phosphatase [Neisseria leonii]|uniref:undecaprenyl-diphosphate phosphatase n=1 Tax=Neisseria leonii TaxID=2995413 RepID=UPI0030D32644